MMTRGIYMDYDGAIHQFYEAESNQYYRLDICKQGTQFQVDPFGVEYSIYRKKTTMEFGDKKIYEEYKKLREAIYNTRGNERTESLWSEGSYYQMTYSDNDNKHFHAKTTMCNGTLAEYEAHLDVYFIKYSVSQEQPVKMEPLNIMQYKEKTLTMGNDHESYTTPYYPYDVLIKRYDLQHILDMDLVVADTEEVAEQRLKEWYESDAEYKGFDTETTGLDIWLHGTDRLTGIILSIDDTSATYFPFGMNKINNLSKEFLDKLMKCCIEQEDRLVAHNKKFDRQVMMMEGYDLRVKWDTMIISFMLNPVTTRGAHALKELIDSIFGEKFLELDEIFISSANIDFSVLDIDITRIYACPDSINAVRLLKHLKPQVPDIMWPIINIEMALADLKADQEYYGIRVDVQKYKSNYENCKYILDMLLTTFRCMTHEDGNIGSPDVLSTLLYDKMGCKVLMRTNTGKRSTSGKAIDKLARQKADKPHNITQNMVDLNGKVIIKAKDLANSKYPALVILSKYREYVKLSTAFYARFERTMSVGRVHFWVNQNGASSGRQSSPMHQLPPELKSVILSDSPTKDLWGPDYSQVELRWIAGLAKEKDLVEMCKDPSNDIHRVCASLITGKEMWEITKAERSIKKRVNFGVVYLISGYGLAGQIYGPGYNEEQVKYCQEQLDAFYKRFKRIDLYLHENARKVRERGYMQTAFARIKYFKEIFDPDITQRKKASLVRQANNMPVQGSAADLMKIAEVNSYNYIRAKGWNNPGSDGLPQVRVMLSIHDEMLISADQSIPMEEIITMIAKCMQVDVDGCPPFFVSPARMDNWEGHSDDSLAIPIPYRDILISDYARTGKSVFQRSFYEVGLPKEKMIELLEDKSFIRDKVEKYLPYATFTKLYGDYSDELDDKHKHRALEAFIQSGNTRYCDDNYVEKLSTYRDGVLHDYMNDLIVKYGPDPQNVADHVRHPSLTHDLIDRFSDDMRGMDLDHVGQISFATKAYMESATNQHVEPEPVETEQETDTELWYAQTENLYQFDKDGNIIYDEDVEEDEDIDVMDDPDYILYRTEGKIYKVWRLMDKILLDVNQLSTDNINKVIARVWQDRDSDGFYSVYLVLDGNMVNTGFKVEDLNTEEVSDLITGLEKVS